MKPNGKRNGKHKEIADGARSATASSLADIGFRGALRSFVGHLEGSQKSANTIANYQTDLRAFETFLSRQNIALSHCEPATLRLFSDALEIEGGRVNTRRRKLLTAAKFLRYLSKRKKLAESLQQKVLTPGKVERVPFVAPFEELARLQADLPEEDLLEMRLKLLVGVLLHSGASVSECVSLRVLHFVQTEREKFEVTLPERTVEIPEAIFRLAQRKVRILGYEWQEESIQSLPTFEGFVGSRGARSVGSPMSARAAEMLIKAWAQKTPWPNLTPRMLRDAAAIHWARAGMPTQALMLRLGLRSAYAMRRYLPLLATSQAEPAPEER